MQNLHVLNPQKTLGSVVQDASEALHFSLLEGKPARQNIVVVRYYQQPRPPAFKTVKGF